MFDVSEKHTHTRTINLTLRDTRSDTTHGDVLPDAREVLIEGLRAKGLNVPDSASVEVGDGGRTIKIQWSTP